MNSPENTNLPKINLPKLTNKEFSEMLELEKEYTEELKTNPKAGNLPKYKKFFEYVYRWRYNSTKKFKVKISEILEIEKRKREINSKELNEIEFLDDDGNPIPINDEYVGQFRFSGLNNTDFITSGFYETGFDK